MQLVSNVAMYVVYASIDAVDSCNNGCSDLWHELEIMKKIDTHQNICNLLACCTAKGMATKWNDYTIIILLQTSSIAYPLRVRRE